MAFARNHDIGHAIHFFKWAYIATGLVVHSCSSNSLTPDPDVVPELHGPVGGGDPAAVLARVRFLGQRHHQGVAVAVLCTLQLHARVLRPEKDLVAHRHLLLTLHPNQGVTVWGKKKIKNYIHCFYYFVEKLLLFLLLLLPIGSSGC